MGTVKIGYNHHTQIMTTIYQALEELEKSNESAALCTVVKSEGSTPRHVGSKMLVYSDGHFIGTVGGGDLEHRVMDEASMVNRRWQIAFAFLQHVRPNARRPGQFAADRWRCLWNQFCPRQQW